MIISDRKKNIKWNFKTKNKNQDQFGRDLPCGSINLTQKKKFTTKTINILSINHRALITDD